MTSAHGEDQDSGSSGRDLTEGSRLVAAGRAIGDWVRHSFLYRWLTKEPEPEVIVIDLRETWTVGPFVALLDRAVARLAPWWRGSGCRRLCTWTATRVVARPVRALGIVLAAVAAVRIVAAVAGGGPATPTLALALGVFAIGALATRSRHSWQDIRETRGYQLLAAALEPPEPPDGAETGEPESDRTGESAASETDEPGEPTADRDDETSKPGESGRESES